MVIKIIEKNDEYYEVADLIESIKKNMQVDEAGAIFTFEGFVRGTEGDKKVSKLTLSTGDIDKTQKELEKMVATVKETYGVFEIAVIHYIGEFYTGDSLFLVAVLGPHRVETLDALKDIIEKTKFELDFQKEEVSNKETKIIMSGG
ncbi:MAG: molybdenum cofactor biosynthesis protein MoaE [Methanobacteriaceae archaeon]